MQNVQKEASRSYTQNTSPSAIQYRKAVSELQVRTQIDCGIVLLHGAISKSIVFTESMYVQMYPNSVLRQAIGTMTDGLMGFLQQICYKQTKILGNFNCQRLQKTIMSLQWN